jgi:TonB family protein
MIHRFAFTLLPLLGLLAGCSHMQPNRPALPSLPASHARLSKALDLYVSQLPESAEDLVPDAVPVDEPSVVVEPDQAPAVYEEAVKVLDGEPSPEQFSQAKDDLHAACRADFAPACVFLREKLESPRRISGKPPEYTNEAIQKRTLATVVLRCKLGTDGRMRDCKVLERAPHGLTESVLEYAARAVYQPVRLAGHPFEVSYTFRFNFRPFRVDLTPAQEIEWARARTERFPQSSPAWMTLANLLARHAPDDPGLEEALRALHLLVPSYWWPANELAWLRVQAGRHAEAAPLAKRAVSREPSNPYVLETSAAVLAAAGPCEQALAEQRRAVEKLPAKWPAPEKERFARTLEQYQRQCAAQPPPG